MPRHCNRPIRYWYLGDGFGAQCKDPHRAHDVLYELLSPILEDVIQPVAHLVPDDAADADPTWLGQPLQPRCDVDPIAENVALFDDHVAEVDTDAEPDPVIFGDAGFPIDHRVLQFGGTADRVDDAREFRQQAVAGVLYNAPSVLADLRFDQFPEVGLEPFVRPLLVGSHQPRVPGHIGGENGGEAAGRGHPREAVVYCYCAAARSARPRGANWAVPATRLQPQYPAHRLRPVELGRKRVVIVG